jgi:hypothetical protein
MRERLALRYALCGTGDVLVIGEGGAQVRPHSCKHRLCPRCGRNSGKRIVRRLMQWIATTPHEDIFAICLTQRTDPSEGVVAARARMLRKLRRFMKWLKKADCLAYMRAHHIIASKRGEGWHYHVHLLLEFPGGRMTTQVLIDAYDAAAAPEESTRDPNSCRLVVAAGPAIKELAKDEGQLDFWNESPSAVARAVQYPIRDLAQGVSAMRLGDDGDRLRECVTELVRESNGWRLRDVGGRWKRKPPTPEDPEEGAEERDASAASSAVPGCEGECRGVGTVHRVMKRALAGDPEARGWLYALECSARNQTEFAKRLVAFCRWAGAGPQPRRSPDGS